MRIKSSISDGRGEVFFWHSEAGSEGPTLIFLHGMTADHTMFAPQLAYFDDKYNLIAWDAPAHGCSRPYRDFSYENAADALFHIVRELSVSRAVLIGQSMGGYIAQAFYKCHPEMVSAIIAIDSTPYGDYYSRLDKWLLRQIEWMSRLFPERALTDALSAQVAVTKAGRENMLAMLQPYNKDELCRLMGLGYAGFLEDNAPLDIGCPLLLLVGERDRTGKVRQYNREWARRTGCELVWIPNAAHNANVDNPTAVNAEIERFLGRM